MAFSHSPRPGVLSIFPVVCFLRCERNARQEGTELLSNQSGAFSSKPPSHPKVTWWLCGAAVTSQAPPSPPRTRGAGSPAPRQHAADHGALPLRDPLCSSPLRSGEASLTRPSGPLPALKMAAPPASKMAAERSHGRASLWQRRARCRPAGWARAAPGAEGGPGAGLAAGRCPWLPTASSGPWGRAATGR